MYIFFGWKFFPSDYNQEAIQNSNMQIGYQNRRKLNKSQADVKTGTLYFSNRIKTNYHIDLILLGVLSMLHISCKFGNDIQIFNNATVRILVKEAKTALNL